MTAESRKDRRTDGKQGAVSPCFPSLIVMDGKRGILSLCADNRRRGRGKLKIVNAKKNRWKLPLAALSACGFLVVASMLGTSALAAFDDRLYFALVKVFRPSEFPLMEWFAFLGSARMLTPIAALLLAFGIARREFRPYGVLSAMDILSAWATNVFLKNLFRRQRPDIGRWLVAERGYSFPSGHAMVSAAFYGYLICVCLLLFKRPWRGISSLLLLLTVAFIGVSRICLGVHYPSDVTAGFFAGSAFALLFSHYTDRFLDAEAAGRPNGSAPHT